MLDVMTCPKCGEGSVPLPESLQETLNEVRRTPGFTAQEMLDRFPGIGVTAINNRLEDLRRIGLVRRQRDSHSWRYYPARKPRK